MSAEELARMIERGREVTMTGGRVAVLLVACGDCQAQRGYLCLAAGGDTTNGVHIQRRRDAAADVRRGPRS